MNSVSGIYVILNLKSKKVYLGQTQNIRKRWDEHRYALNHNKHKNRHLQSAWNKYGSNHFVFKILEYCSIEQLDEREEHHVKIYKSRNMAYNIADGGKSRRGIIRTIETRNKLSESRRGKSLSEETRSKLSAIMKTRIFTEEHRRKLSEASKGNKQGAENLRRLAALRKGQKRSPLSLETRQKISASEKGKIVSAETRQKLSDSHKGQVPHNKGVSPSEEVRRKMSESAKLRNARRRVALNDGDES